MNVTPTLIELLTDLDHEFTQLKTASPIHTETHRQNIGNYFTCLIDLLGADEATTIFFTHYNTIIPPQQADQLPVCHNQHTCIGVPECHHAKAIRLASRWYRHTWDRYPTLYSPALQQEKSSF